MAGPIAVAPVVVNAAAKAAPKIIDAVKAGGPSVFKSFGDWVTKATGGKIDVSKPLASVDRNLGMTILEGAHRAAPSQAGRISAAMYNAEPALTDAEWNAYVAGIRAIMGEGDKELVKQSETRLDGKMLAVARAKEAQLVQLITDINNGNMTVDGVLNLCRVVHDFDADQAEILTANNRSLATTRPTMG